MHNEPCLPEERRDAGFTIGEALIGIVLTLVVISGAIETLTTAVNLVGTSRVISETNHGLQAAMSLLTRDLMQTGEGIPTGGIPVPAGGGAQRVLRPGPGEALTLQFPASATMPALSPGQGLGPTLLGITTDLITVLYVDRTLTMADTTAIAADGSTMTVPAATPVTNVGGLQAGDLILFTNSYGSALQMVTTTPTTQTVAFATNDAMRINQRSAPQGTILQLQNADDTFPLTQISRVLMITYYVDRLTDPELPRLVRRVNAGDELAIAMGVENLQFTFDLVDGSTNPTNVPEPTGANSANQLRKVNVFLSARSQDLNPRTDQFFRNSLTTQVGLRSLSFVDRYK